MSRKPKGRAAEVRKKTAPNRDLLVLPMEPAAACEISLDYHLTLELLSSGHGSEYHVGSIAQAAFTTMLLSRWCCGEVREDLFSETKAAVVRCWRVGIDTGVWLVDEEAHALFGEVLTLLDHQLAVVPLKEFEVASAQLKAVFGAAPRSPAVGPVITIVRGDERSL
jgi:hypothetical protein